MLAVIYFSLYFLSALLVSSIIIEFLFEKRFSLAKKIAYFSLEAGPTLGLLGTFLSFTTHKDLLQKVLETGNVGKIIVVFLDAWGTSIIGIVIALLGLLFIFVLKIREDESDESKNKI